MISRDGPGHSPGIMGHTPTGSLPVSHLDTLTFVGLERSHLRNAVYRRVFGDSSGPVSIGRYSILERIGAGARGVVFKAFDNQLDRLVALKVFSTRADDRDELVREAKALARLTLTPSQATPKPEKVGRSSPRPPSNDSVRPSNSIDTPATFAAPGGRRSSARAIGSSSTQGRLARASTPVWVSSDTPR